MSEEVEKGKRCVGKIAREVATSLGLTSICFKWGGEESNLRIPLRITTDQGVTEPAMRFAVGELIWCCNRANQQYDDVGRKLKKTLKSFSRAKKKRIGFR